MKRICDGCVVAATRRGMRDCPFCRTPLPEDNGHGASKADRLAMVQVRVAKNDPQAIHFLGLKYYSGGLGLRKDIRRAYELYTEAAELGSIEALFSLGCAYFDGEDVQEDKAKAFEFFTKAAMQGHVPSRHNLGLIEENKGNYGRAVRHFLISAKMGDEDSLEMIKDMFMSRRATKEQYTEALRGYQDAVEETKSPQRDEAKAYSKRLHPND